MAKKQKTAGKQLGIAFHFHAKPTILILEADRFP